MDDLGRTPHMHYGFLQMLCYQWPTVSVIAFLQTTDAPNWATLGVGGALAGIMFFFYREDRKRSEQALEKVAEDFREVVTENSRVIATLVERLHNEDKLNA